MGRRIQGLEKKRMRSLKIEPHLDEKVKAVAEEQGKSANALYEEGVKIVLERHEKKKARK